MADIAAMGAQVKASCGELGSADERQSCMQMVDACVRYSQEGATEFRFVLPSQGELNVAGGEGCLRMVQRAVRAFGPGVRLEKKGTPPARETILAAAGEPSAPPPAAPPPSERRFVMQSTAETFDDIRRVNNDGMTCSYQLMLDTYTTDGDACERMLRFEQQQREIHEREDPLIERHMADFETAARAEQPPAGKPEVSCRYSRTGTGGNVFIFGYSEASCGHFGLARAAEERREGALRKTVDEKRQLLKTSFRRVSIFDR